MRELIRHILKEQSSKLDLLKIIQNEDIFDAADLVGGIHNLRKIFKDNSDVVEKLDSFNGRLDLIYHSKKEYIEIPMKFEIVGKAENVFKNNSWPKVNLIYDDSKLNESEKKLFEQFIYDTIGDLNIDNVVIAPSVRQMFREKNGYIAINYVNGRDLENLDHDIRYEDDDIKNLHREYYTKSYMNESKIIQENEEDPTQKILNFLVRRYKFEKKNFGSEDDPLIFKIVSFDLDDEINVISDFQDKRAQIGTIVDMLSSYDIIEPIDRYEGRLDPYTQKVIRAVKTFINQVMSDKSKLNESKILDKIKSFFGKKPLTKEEMKDEKILNLIVKFINESYTMEGTRDQFGTVTIYLVDDTGNTIYPPIMKYYPDNKVLDYSWEFTTDIHSMIGDERLLHLDSELMGKIFEKLFKKKINKVYGYSRL